MIGTVCLNASKLKVSWQTHLFLLLFNKFKNLEFAKILQVAADELEVQDLKVFMVFVWCS